MFARQGLFRVLTSFPRLRISKPPSTPHISYFSTPIRTFTTSRIARMVHVQTIKLQPSGDEMPQVGFGLWKVTNDTCADQVYNAIKTGYRLFDGAFGMSLHIILLEICANVDFWGCQTMEMRRKPVRVCSVPSPMVSSSARIFSSSPSSGIPSTIASMLSQLPRSRSNGGALSTSTCSTSTSVSQTRFNPLPHNNETDSPYSGCSRIC